MKRINRFFCTTAIFLLFVSLTGCFHEEFFSEDPNPYGENSGSASYNDMYFGSSEPPVSTEVLKASYKGEISPLSLATSDSCDSLKEQIILAWEKKLNNGEMNGCSTCAFHDLTMPYFDGLFSPFLSNLVVGLHELFFIDREELHIIALSDSGEMSQAAKKDLGFQPVSLYLNGEQKTLTVFGLAQSSDQNALGIKIAIFDVSTVTESKLVETLYFKDSYVVPIKAGSGELVLGVRKELRLPGELTFDQDFQELSTNYHDAKRLKELYDYAVEHTEGDVPQELLDLQQGASVLVAVYQDLFNAKFDSVVSDVNELLPGFIRIVGDTEEVQRPLSCQGVYTQLDEKQGEENVITQILKLDMSPQQEHKTLAILGAYQPVSYENDKVTLLKNSFSQDYLAHPPVSAISSFDLSGESPVLGSAAQIPGMIEQAAINVIGDNVYLLSVQLVGTEDLYYREYGMINLFILKSTSEGYEKLNEEPYIATTYGLYLNGQVAFGKDAMLFDSFDHGEEVYINYADPLNVTKSNIESDYFINTIAKVEGNKFVRVIQEIDFSSDHFVNHIQLIDLSHGLQVVNQIDGQRDKDMSFGYSNKLIKTKDGYLFGTLANNPEFSQNTVRTEMSLFMIDDVNGLSSVGSVSRSSTEENFGCVYKMPNNECLEMNSYVRPAWDPRLAGSMEINGKEFVVNFTDSEIALNEIDNLANEKLYVVTH